MSDGGAELAEADRVLQAFLDYLPQAAVPGLGETELLDAWVEPPSAVCVVFRRRSAGVIGYRRTFPPHAEPGNPESSGIDLADDMSEPMGNVHLNKDPETGISWVGVAELQPFPVRPQPVD